MVPGAVWSTVFIILSMLPLWLEQYFPGVIWVAPVAGLLAIALKVWEVYKPQDAPQVMSRDAETVSQTSKGKRLLLG